jgi:hypothetical protein
MKPENADYDDWDEHPQCQTGARRVSDIAQDSELGRELMPTDPPSAQEGEAPFSVRDPDGMPTQPDLDPPPGAPRANVETYIDDLVDSEDFRDTIPAPVPPSDEL